MYRMLLAIISVCFLNCASQTSAMRNSIPEDPCVILAEAIERSVFEMRIAAEEIMAEKSNMVLSVNMEQMECSGTVLTTRIIMKSNSDGRTVSRILAVRLELVGDGAIGFSMEEVKE